ncbi:MAG: hypothetical protein P4M15_02010 [Alphaproteobacteria bacterium]|nr:hypothetical protein [Alphaproteobacteria bacterium]
MTKAAPQAALWTKILIAVLSVVIGMGTVARAADLPLAATSPLTGVAFDDRPLQLPVQRNFQMAMLTAGSEMGRSCGKMEAYGWRMGQAEQARVNQIFNNTVDRMRLMGFTIAPQTISSVSSDITLFTADRSDRHFIFLWSAGELGLVMTLCETTAPLSPTYKASPLVPSVQTFPVPTDVVSTQLAAPSRNATKEISDNFTPLGQWTGTYTCAQGLTGGTLEVHHLRGQNFDGVFKFYPTAKNTTVPEGSYEVYGQYDQTSKRILINPGTWIHHPAHFYDTVMVGSFDPIHQSFSAYFQGITGCTSFEARREGQTPHADIGKKHHAKPKKHVVKKHAAKKKKAAVKKAEPVAAETPAPIPSTMPTLPADAVGVPVPSNLPVAAPAVPAASAVPAAPVPVAPAVAPASVPATSAAPAPAAGLTVIPVTPGYGAAPAPVPTGTPAPDAGITLPGTK